MNFLSQFIDSGKVGGWARSGTAALLAVMIGRWPLLSTYLDPGAQQALGVIVAGVAVAVWSQLTKTDNAKLAAVEALPGVASITVKASATDGVAAAAADPSRPKVKTL